MSNTFCPLPWIHLATRPNGDVRVCCTANASGAGKQDEKEAGLVKQDGVRMNLRDHSIEEIWNSSHMRRTRLQMLNGEIPESCKKCFIEESKGIRSKRNWETEVWNQRLDIDNIVSKTKDDGSLPVEIPYYDLRLGNLCNLKCVMCSPHDSSSWIKDWKLQYPNYKNKDLINNENWNPAFDYTWYKKSSFINSIKDDAKNIKELYFAGGEPLLIPEHSAILDFMIESGNAKNCVLRYNTNGTIIEDSMISKWEKFKSVKVNFSVDNISERNEYIRYPSIWSDIISNLERLDQTPDNITVNLACAVQLLNITTLPLLAEWKHDMKFKKINKPPFGAGTIGLHLVYLPSHMNVKVLPKIIKDRAADNIEKFIATQTDKEFIENPYGKQRWQGLVNYMYSEDWTDKLPATLEYLTSCDKTRNTNFRNIFPELGEL